MPTLNTTKLAINALKKKKKEEVVTPTPKAVEPIKSKTSGGGSSSPEVIRDQDTGKPSFVKIGDKYFNASPNEIKGLVENYTQKRELPQGALEATDVAKQQELLKLSEQTGQLTPEQKTLIQQRVEQEPTGFQNFNLGQAASAGIMEGGIYAAGAGIVTGAGTSPISWAAIGAGGLAGFIKGSYSNIKEQQSGLVKAETLNVDRAITQLNNIVSARNLGASAEETQLLYTQVVENTYASWSRLQLQTRGSALKAFDDGTKELEKFEIFFNEDGGTLSTINLKMNQALINPNPSKISASDVNYEGE